MMQRRRKKIGEILIAQGLITNEQLLHALEEHKRSGLSLGAVLVHLGYITEDDLSGVLGKQIQLEQRKRLGEILIDQGFITPQQLENGLQEQKKTGLQLGKCLVRLGYISEPKIIDVLSAQLDIQHVMLEGFSFDRDLIKRIPEEMARKYKAIPLFEKDGVITVAMTDPTDLRTIDHLKFKTGREIEPVIATEASIIGAIERQYAEDLDRMTDLIGEVDADDLDIIRHDEENTLTDEEGAQVVKIVNLIINQAIAEDATDIHIEPMDRYVRLRYRIDGELREKSSIPLQLRAQIASRIKIMSGMDIAERRKPQDGHFQIRHQGREVDLRVSTFPTVTRKHGVNEKIVMRVIDQEGKKLGLEDIGFLPHTLSRFDQIIRQPDGIMLVTGPTGSGKSSTLYAALRRINAIYENKKNVITMEDPVETNIEGICQGQINPKAGFDFADGMRAILRQDPDIIMIGEMRDQETSEMAIRAAITGHFVFSTLHTNDSASAFTRLADMGLESFLIASTIRGILAQRLVRKICTRCREAYDPDPGLLQQLGLRPGIKLYTGKGCRHCNDTGYSGRTGIFELLAPDQEVKRMVTHDATSDEIAAYAVKAGLMEPLRRDGLRKAVDGITTLEQVMGATQA